MYLCSKCRERPAVKGQFCTACRRQAMKEAAAAKAKELRQRVEAAPGHKLGDKVAAVAKALGFAQTADCGCAKKQAALNEVDLKQSPVQVVKDVAKALKKK